MLSIGFLPIFRQMLLKIKTVYQTIGHMQTKEHIWTHDSKGLALCHIDGHMQTHGHLRTHDSKKISFVSNHWSHGDTWTHADT